LRPWSAITRRLPPTRWRVRRLRPSTRLLDSLEKDDSLPG
jgi:hypothetical protein